MKNEDQLNMGHFKLCDQCVILNSPTHSVSLEVSFGIAGPNFFQSLFCNTTQRNETNKPEWFLEIDAFVSSRSLVTRPSTKNKGPRDKAIVPDH